MALRYIRMLTCGVLLHEDAVAFVCWSPDDSMLLTRGTLFHQDAVALCFTRMLTCGTLFYQDADMWRFVTSGCGGVCVLESGRQHAADMRQRLSGVSVGR